MASPDSTLSFSRRSLLKGLSAAAAVPAAHSSAASRQRSADGKFNVIHIGVDTWSAHWINCYGLNASIQTPFVDALAARSAMFMDAYPNALPTVPVRRGVYTGRQVFPSYMVRMREGGTNWRGWHPLYREDVTVAESFRDSGYRTQLISDVYHQFQPAMNFQFGFNGFTWIRDQETDRAATGPVRGIDPSRYMHASTPNIEGQVSRYLLNRYQWQTEEDWPTHRLFAEAGSWLDSNTDDNQPFYLHIECYSPHEMWDPPEEYYRRYMKSDYSGPRLIFPPTSAAKMTAVELEHARALYAGMVSFVDSRIGIFLKRVLDMGLLENTIIVFVADHGTFQGEQGDVHKGEGLLRTQLLHVPLLIYHPYLAGMNRRIRGFVQHADIMPTLLDLNGIQCPARVTGKSLRPLMETGASSDRDIIYGGWNDHGFIRTPDWSYIGRWNPGEAYEEIYDVRKDPLELKNVIQDQQSLMNDFRARLQAHVAAGWNITKGNFLQADPQSF